MRGIHALDAPNICVHVDVELARKRNKIKQQRREQQRDRRMGRPRGRSLAYSSSFPDAHIEQRREQQRDRRMGRPRRSLAYSSSFPDAHIDAAVKIQSCVRAFFARWPIEAMYQPYKLPWSVRVHWRHGLHLSLLFH